MVKKIGIIGLSEGNGHPFSFSSIINGFSESELKKSGWDVIYNYVTSRDKSEFGFMGAQITHAWTQNKQVTRLLCDACLIPNALENMLDMITEVDAVIIARDDYENHLSMSLPFLEAGLHVFIDKPLAIDIDELRIFEPYLRKGKLMSCSGMKFAKELDEIRRTLHEYGKIKLIRGSVVQSWEKYGVHMVDAICSFIYAEPLAIQCLDADHTSMSIELSDRSLVQIDCLGKIPKDFGIQVWGEEKISSYQITDNFSMFRRTLWHFVNSIHNDHAIRFSEGTLLTMKLLIAGIMSKSEGRKVMLNELQL